MVRKKCDMRIIKEEVTEDKDTNSAVSNPQVSSKNDGATGIGYNCRKKSDSAPGFGTVVQIKTEPSFLANLIDENEVADEYSPSGNERRDLQRDYVVPTRSPRKGDISSTANYDIPTIIKVESDPLDIMDEDMYEDNGVDDSFSVDVKPELNCDQNGNDTHDPAIIPNRLIQSPSKIHVHGKSKQVTKSYAQAINKRGTAIKKKHPCAICRQVFFSRRDLVNHKASSHVRDANTMPTASKRSTKTKTLLKNKSSVAEPPIKQSRRKQNLHQTIRHFRQLPQKPVRVRLVVPKLKPTVPTPTITPPPVRNRKQKLETRLTRELNATTLKTTLPNASKAPKPQICRICQYPAPSIIKFEKHFLLSHPGEPQFLCKYCGFGFSKELHLTAHVKFLCKALINPETKKIPDDERKYRCSLCPKAYTSDLYLSRHYKTSHPEAPRMFPCSLCSMQFSTVSLELRHVKNVHEGGKKGELERKRAVDAAIRKLNAVSETERQTCRLCPYWAPTYIQLWRHFRQVHPDNGMYRCDFCGTQNRKKDTHIRHLRDECKFIGTGTLQILKSKSGVTPVQPVKKKTPADKEKYRCSLCPRGFARMSGLSRHQNMCHSGPAGINTFPCSLCSLKFSTLSLHYRHIKTMHPASLGIN